MQQVIKIHNKDNVMVALRDLEKKSIANHYGEQYVMVNKVKAKHKFAIQDLNIGDDIIMYGVIVGEATRHIKRGETITVSNIQHKASSFNLSEVGTAPSWQALNIDHWKNKTFDGYHREDG